MSSVIGALRVNLGLDSAKFESGARRVKSPVAVMKKQFIAVAAAAAAVGGAIATMALKGAKDIDVAAKSARRLGTSVGGFRALQLAAGEAGVSVSALANDVQTMDREIARGSKNAKSALDKLGLSAKDLESLEADQKVALIADRVKSLGLNSGEASVLLQDLGVRNREMVLAVLSGGDAFRRARADIEEYGLAISRTDSEAIEQANDRIGRLGLIGQYAGQQLAIALVPRMGELAQAMTDSLREGGLLRVVIDGLANNLERVGTYIAVAVAGFGVRYVGALALARLATFSFAGSLAFLRGAIIRTGIGALIVGAGELVFQFTRLMKGAGGFGAAMGLLGDVAAAVWQGFIGSAAAIPPALNGVWARMKAGFLFALSGMATSFHDFVWKIANGMNGVQGFEAMGASLMGLADSASEASGSLYRAGHKAQSAASGSFSKAAGTIATAFGPARDAVEALKSAVAATSDEVVGAANSVSDLDDALEDAGDGGKAGGKGAKAIEELSDKAKALKEQMDEVKGTFKSAFTGIVTGAKSVKEAIKGILSKFADMLASSAFDAIWSGLGGGGKTSGGGFLSGILGSIFPSAKGNVFSNGSAIKAFAKGGVVNGPTLFPMSGAQTGLMGEAGPEAIVPLSRGANGKLGIESKGGGRVEIIVRNEPGVVVEIARNEAGAIFRQSASEIVGQSVGAAQNSFRKSKSGWSP